MIVSVPQGIKSIIQSLHITLDCQLRLLVCIDVLLEGIDRYVLVYLEEIVKDKKVTMSMARRIEGAMTETLQFTKIGSIVLLHSLGDRLCFITGLNERGNWS